MVDPASQAAQASAQSLRSSGPSPQAVAQQLIGSNQTANGLDIAGIRRDLETLTGLDTALGSQVRQTITAQLTPVEQGLLARSPTLIQAQATGAPMAANDPGPDVATLALDLGQIALDVVGIFEPTPFADGANTLISLGRGEWLNAGLSALGIIPYVGDLAKLGKLGKWAQTVSNGIELAVANPAARAALEPALRRIADAVSAIPDGAMRSLPDDAQQAIRGMKAQLDEFFGAGARQVDEAAGAIRQADNIGQTVRINGQEVTIGATPTTATRADGAPQARNAAGDEVTLRQPATYDSRVVNADGTVTYTKGANSVQYDANGFPIFNSQADVFLSPEKLVVGSRSTHFSEANRMLARSSDDQLRAAGFSDADISTLRSGDTPDNFTWHHHQDVGRMQLVRTSEHELFRGGHSGGWSLWGDAGRFTVE